jgi:hypothetical protein
LECSPYENNHLAAKISQNLQKTISAPNRWGGSAIAKHSLGLPPNFDDHPSALARQQNPANRENLPVFGMLFVQPFCLTLLG